MGCRLVVVGLSAHKRPIGTKRKNELVMRVLILEDEIYYFHQLRHLLEDMGTEYDVIGPITSVEQGRDYLSLHKDIDIIIADTELSDGLCFEALAYAPYNIPVVFIATTGEHALRAFDFCSLSYLLRPFEDSQFVDAVVRARKLHAIKMFHAERKEREKLGGAQHKYRQRFVVKSFNGERIVLLSTIQYIVSEHKTTYLVLLDGTSWPVDVSLDALSQELDPDIFMKVNRKFIVPIEQVCGMERLVNGKELLKLKTTPSPEIIVSRTRKTLVRKWLDR